MTVHPSLRRICPGIETDLAYTCEGRDSTLNLWNKNKPWNEISLPPTVLESFGKKWIIWGIPTGPQQGKCRMFDKLLLRQRKPPLAPSSRVSTSYPAAYSARQASHALAGNWFDHTITNSEKKSEPVGPGATTQRPLLHEAAKHGKEILIMKTPQLLPHGNAAYHWTKSASMKDRLRPD